MRQTIRACYGTLLFSVALGFWYLSIAIATHINRIDPDTAVQDWLNRQAECLKS